LRAPPDPFSWLTVEIRQLGTEMYMAMKTDFADASFISALFPDVKNDSWRPNTGSRRRDTLQSAWVGSWIGLLTGENKRLYRSARIVLLLIAVISRRTNRTARGRGR